MIPPVFRTQATSFSYVQIGIIRYHPQKIVKQKMKGYIIDRGLEIVKKIPPIGSTEIDC